MIQRNTEFQIPNSKYCNSAFHYLTADDLTRVLSVDMNIEEPSTKTAVKTIYKTIEVTITVRARPSPEQPTPPIPTLIQPEHASMPAIQTSDLDLSEFEICDEDETFSNEILQLAHIQQSARLERDSFPSIDKQQMQPVDENADYTLYNTSTISTSAVDFSGGISVNATSIDFGFISMYGDYAFRASQINASLVVNARDDDAKDDALGLIVDLFGDARRAVLMNMRLVADMKLRGSLFNSSDYTVLSGEFAFINTHSNLHGPVLTTPFTVLQFGATGVKHVYVSEAESGHTMLQFALDGLTARITDITVTTDAVISTHAETNSFVGTLGARNMQGQTAAVNAVGVSSASVSPLWAFVAIPLLLMAGFALFKRINSRPNRKLYKVTKIGCKIVAKNKQEEKLLTTGI